MTPLFDDKLTAFVGRMAGDIAAPYGGDRPDEARRRGTSRRGETRRTVETPYNLLLEARL